MKMRGRENAEKSIAGRLLSVLFLLLLTAALFFAASSAVFFSGGFLPDWIQWESRELRYPLGENAYGTAILRNRRFLLYKNEECLFRSEPGWRVSDMLSGDIDRDGQEELLLLVWKRGSYGRHLPFWVEKNDREYSQHVFIYRYDQERFHAVWMSSALGFSIQDWSIEEGTIRTVRPDGEIAFWQWHGFGLELLEGEEAVTEARSEERAAEIGFSREIPGRNPVLHSGFESSKEQEAQKKGEGEGRNETQKEEQKEERNETRKEEQKEKQKEEQGGELSLLAVGDNLIHSGICRNAYRPETGSYDFSPLYEHVRETIQRYDLAFVNQETIFTENQSRYGGELPCFGSPTAVGGALSEAGFDIVGCANNHCYDLGNEGLEDTLRFWKEYPEMTVLGVNESEEARQRICYLEKNGIRLALFNYTYGLNGRRLPAGEEWRVNLLSEKDRLLRELRTAEQEADLSVCFLHMGEEYASEPREEQKAYLRELIDAGADLILCTHPHVLAPFGELRTETGNCAVVYYSLGNFIANQTQPEAQLGGAASLTIRKKRGKASGNGAEEWQTEITDYELLPLVCHWGGGETEAYFLTDYSREHSEQHYCSKNGSPELLKEFWRRYALYREKRAWG